MAEPPHDVATKTLLLYDGVCGLCARSVQFVLRRDRRDRFRFAALQSAFARAIVTRHGFDPDDLDSFAIVDGVGTSDERMHRKGRAALLVLARLGGVYALTAPLRLLPNVLLDLVYDFVARRRYRWFGRTETCFVPAKSDRAKFVE
jgi:predicted DCC family thiol-disulfide oxidoreductase YuxK